MLNSALCDIQMCADWKTRGRKRERECVIAHQDGKEESHDNSVSVCVRENEDDCLVYRLLRATHLSFASLLRQGCVLISRQSDHVGVQIRYHS